MEEILAIDWWVRVQRNATLVRVACAVWVALCVGLLVWGVARWSKQRDACRFNVAPRHGAVIGGVCHYQTDSGEWLPWAPDQEEEP